MTQPMIMILLPLLALAMATGAALAQQRTCYDGGGRVTGRSSTDSQGSTTIYTLRGRVTGRTSTDTQGTTRFYSPGGRNIGRSTASPQR